MGCWNHTCMLSNLPVKYGEEIATIILTQTREGYANCDSRRDWCPAPVMYYGKYDDYGGSENCHGAAIPYILNEFLRNQPTVEEGKEQAFDDIEKFSRMGDAGELVLCGNNNGNVKQPVRLAVIKQSVLDRLLERYYFTSYHLTTSTGEEVKITYKYLCGTIPLYVAKLKEHMADAELRSWNLLPDVDWDDTDILGSWLGHHERDVVVQFFRLSFIHRLRTLVAPGNDEELTAMLEEFCKYMIILSFMTTARRTYTHATGGSQDMGTDAQETIAQITLEAAEQQRREWEEEDFPDDAWDPVREVFMEQAGFEFKPAA